MNIFSISTIIMMMLLFNIFAQAPDTLWTKTFGDSAYNEGTCVQQTSDGGYIITGATGLDSWSQANLWLIKTNAFGDMLWTNKFECVSGNIGNSVRQTSNGGYIVTGQANIGFHSYWTTYSDFGVIKTDTLGDTLWTKIFSKNTYSVGNSVQETVDGGYILCGNTGHSSNGPSWQNLWLIKINSTGDTLWTKTYDNAYWDLGNFVQQTTDSGYIIIGTVGNPYSPSNIWLIKTDSLGDTLWTKTFGDTLSDEGKSGQQTSDGGYIILGNTQSLRSGENVLLIKTDASGNIDWKKTYGGGDDDVGNSVRQTSDGGYIVTGQTLSFGSGENDIWLIKTDASGDTLWTKTFGGTGEDVGKSVIETTDGGYIITGRTDSFGAGESDVWLIKTTPDLLNSIQTAHILVTQYHLLQNYPNPFNPSTTIEFTLPKSEFVTLKIYNILGEEVATLVQDKLQAGNYTYQFNGSNLASGVYLYRIEAGVYQQVSKMILLR